MDMHALRPFVLIVCLGLCPDTSPRETALLRDSFAGNPETSPHWVLKRWNSPTDTREPENKSERGYHDAKAGFYYLSRKRGYCGMSMFAKAPLKSKRWLARFRYRTSGKGRLANGFVFVFYKKPVAKHNTGSGSSLAFEGTPGYGIFFDTYARDVPERRSVSIIKDSVYKKLATVADMRVGDQKWHDVEVVFMAGKITVRIDKQKVLEHTIRDMNYAQTGFGFTCAVGAALTDHAIDNFVLIRR